MTTRTTTNWDYTKKEYTRVPDLAIDRYVSICNGTYLFDCGYMIDRALIRARWPVMSDEGMLIERGVIVVEYEHLSEFIETLQHLLCEIDTRGPDRLPIISNKPSSPPKARQSSTDGLYLTQDRLTGVLFNRAVALICFASASNLFHRLCSCWS